MTPDTWNIRDYIRHMTQDKWHVTHGGGVIILSIFQLITYFGWAGKWFEDVEEKADSLIYLINELDGVGPVDNRPSTNKFHHFVQKINKNKIK